MLAATDTASSSSGLRFANAARRFTVSSQACLVAETFSFSGTHVSTYGAVSLTGESKSFTPFPGESLGENMPVFLLARRGV